MGNLGSLVDPYWIAALAIVALSFAKAPRDWRSTLKAGGGWIFFVLALIYMALLLAVPRSTIAARVSFPASVFLICYIASVFVRRPITPVCDRAMALILSALLMLHTALVVPQLLNLARIHQDWALDPQLRMGPDTNVVLPIVRINGRIVYVHKHVFFEGFTSNPAYFVNECYAQANNVKTVVAR
jgi:hypothetical protein